MLAHNARARILNACVSRYLNGTPTRRMLKKKKKKKVGLRIKYIMLSGKCLMGVASKIRPFDLKRDLSVR